MLNEWDSFYLHMRFSLDASSCKKKNLWPVISHTSIFKEGKKYILETYLSYSSWNLRYPVLMITVLVSVYSFEQITQLFFSIDRQNWIPSFLLGFCGLTQKATKSTKNNLMFLDMVFKQAWIPPHIFTLLTTLLDLNSRSQYRAWQLSKIKP